VAGENLLVIRLSSALRATAQNEVRQALGAIGRGGFVTDIHVETSTYAPEIEVGYWDESEGYIRSCAEQIRRRADELGSVELHYFGIGEIPHVIALGAYVSDERFVHVHDYDRDLDAWTWPESEQTLVFAAKGVPRKPISVPRPIVIRVSVSDTVSDSEVSAVLGTEKLVDVSIGPEGRTPTRGIVRSAADVAAFRKAFRNVLAELARVREIDTIHLFVAAPPSICFVIGQELHLRSGSAVQTYRHRVVEGKPSYREAIRLTAGDLAAGAAPPPETERASAGDAVTMGTRRVPQPPDTEAQEPLRIRLGELGLVRGGYVAPGATTDQEEPGNPRALQGGDLAADGSIPWDSLRFAQLSGGVERYAIREGDVLLPLRSARINAVVATGIPFPVVAVGHWALVAVDPTMVDPHYLAWYFNHPTTSLRLNALSQGSNLKFISLGKLRDFEVELPRLRVQHQLARVHALHRRVAQLEERLGDLRRQYVDALTMSVLRGTF
jgi:hypothetical protein